MCSRKNKLQTTKGIYLIKEVVITAIFTIVDELIDLRTPLKGEYFLVKSNKSYCLSVFICGYKAIIN